MPAVERIAAGFSLAEAPVVTGDDVLLVSDVMGGGVRRFDAHGVELPPLLDKRRGIGGMALLDDGTVVMSGRDLSRVGADDATELFAPLQEGGTGYNDIAVTPEGGVLAGMLTCNPFGGGDLTPGVAVLVGPDGSARSAPLPFDWPNGIGFSPAGDTLYFVDYATGVVHASRWTGDLGDVALEPWVTSPTGEADGLAVTPDGDVWLASGNGGSVLRFDAGGDQVGSLDVPDEFVSSCCLWPAHDRLVVTTGTGVFFHALG